MDVAEANKSIEYLSCCKILEEKAFLLYTNLSEKINHPELNSILVAITYESLKHSKVIEGWLHLIAKDNLSPEFNGDLAKTWKEMSRCLDKLSSIELVDDETLTDFIKELLNLEDCMHDNYVHFLESKIAKNFVANFLSLNSITMDNLTFSLNMMIEDTVRRRAMLVEAIYFLNKNKLGNVANKAPFVKYKNPDAWIMG